MPEDPDNLDLNLRYARQQVAETDLLGASGTLERILMINPALAPVRLFYAVVLYRLDDAQEAQRELQLLLEVEDLPETLRVDVEKQLKKILLRRRTTRFTLRQNFGYGVDNNRNSASNSKTALSSEAAIAVTGTSLRRRDTSFLTVQNLNVTHDLGFQAGHEIFGGFTYFLQEQTMADNLDLQSFGGEIGGTYKSDIADVTGSLFLNHVFLSRESYLRALGIRVSASGALNDRWTASSSVNIERQDYLNISDNNTAVQREGMEIHLDESLSYLLSPSMRVNGGIGYTHKEARKKFNAAETLNVNGSFVWLLGKGQYLLQSMTVGFDFYKKSDPTRAAFHRRDRTLRARSTYGIPLRSLQIEKIWPKPLGGDIVGDMTITLTYEMYRSVSNLTNFTYNNHKFQGMLSKTWEF